MLVSGYPDHPLDEYISTVSIWWVTVALATLIVALRVFLVRHQRREFKAVGQDCFLLLTYILIVAVTATSTAWLSYTNKAKERTWPLDTFEGGEWWSSYLNHQEKVIITKFSFASYLLFICALWSCKATLFSIFFSLVRKSPVIPNWFKYMVYGGALYLGLTFLATFFSHLFYCAWDQGPWDVSINWKVYHDPDMFRPSDLCVASSEWPMFSMFAAFSISTDLILLITGWISLYLVRSRQISFSRELVAVTFTTLLGLFSLSATVVRFSIEITRIHILADCIAKQTMGTWPLWIGVELMFAVLACGLPTARAVLRLWRKPQMNRRGYYNGDSEKRLSGSTTPEMRSGSVDAMKDMEPWPVAAKPTAGV